MMNLFLQFLLALFATLGFSVIFRVPIKKIPACVLIGAFGWLAYEIAFYYLESPVFGCFIGACMVGLLSSIAAKVLKEASTVFVIPGILCLVPGFKIYSTMEELLLHNYGNTAEIGVQTLMMAGAIAIGLLVMGVAIGLVRLFVGKVRGLTAK